ncbi:dermonecrotic toxin domain-containing protein [Pseudomonas vranovensis]|uniref:dermonecrotic toxin domain-containing protein n=2 Tax=Pseudomonas TaxID=286 RepID=UPI0012EBB51B|nr:DUF6543 domain-containing protein [Pseudomonas vranovensis]
MSTSNEFPTPSTAQSGKTNPHYDLLKYSLPTWLINAPSAMHQALRQTAPEMPAWLAVARREKPGIVQALVESSSRHYQLEQQIKTVLAQLPSPENYAEPLLKATLKERFGLDVDVRNTSLFHARRVIDTQSFLMAYREPLVEKSKAINAATQSVLVSALQNFEDWETTSGGMTDSSARIDVPSTSSYVDPASK